MLKLILYPEQEARPGYGLLDIFKWDHPIDGDLELVVTRHDDLSLGENGEWGGNRVWHIIEAKSVVNKIQALLGPALIDAIVSGGLHGYQLTVRDQNANQDYGTLQIKTGLLSSLAQGSSILKESTIKTSNIAPTSIDPLGISPIDTPPTKLETTPQEPQTEDTNLETRDSIQQPQASDLIPEQEVSKPDLALESKIAVDVDENIPPKSSQSSKTTNIIIVLIICLLVLLIAGGVYWWFFMRTPSTSSDPKNMPACSEQGLKEQSDDLVFTQNCLNSNPSSQDILNLIQIAKQQNRCDTVIRLYGYRARSGDATVALAYAEEYDPKTHQKNACFPEADPETAVYYYEMVLEQQTDNQSVKDRIKELKP